MDFRKGGLRLLGALAALWLGAPLFMPGCSTGAVGVDACRQIESARCVAAPDCRGQGFDLETEEQVDNCITFYNDHCLVGLENTTEEPLQDDVDRCVAVVEAVAKCARNQDVVTMDDCRDADDDQRTIEGQAGITPCEALQEPELLLACKFVAEKKDPDEDE